MTLMLNVPEDLLEDVRLRAQESGIDIEQYVIQRLESDRTAKPPRKFDPDEPFESWSKRLHSAGFTLPEGVVISEKAYDRETAYED